MGYRGIRSLSAFRRNTCEMTPRNQAWVEVVLCHIGSLFSGLSFLGFDGGVIRERRFFWH